MAELKWKLSRGHDQKFRAQDGRSEFDLWIDGYWLAASVCPNGAWFTWDREGRTREHGMAGSVVEARRLAVAAVVAQGWVLGVKLLEGWHD